MADEVTIKVDGIEEAVKSLKKYQIIKRQAIEDIIKETAFKIERDAKKSCPVDTGRLRSSISVARSGYPSPPEEDKVKEPAGERGLVAVIGSNVIYAPYVELGTYKMNARPYLYPAYHTNEPDALKRIKTVLKKKD